MKDRPGGSATFVPMDLDRTFWEVLSPDHALVLQNAVAWAAGAPPPLAVEGAGLLDVALWRQERSVTAHLVNLTNPMAMKGPFREIFPVRPFRVSIELPAGARPARARLLEAGREAPFRREGGRVTLAVPRVRVHEVVAVDLD